ncbi:hypothetical protein BDV26DRAFT_288918 [Aspergillus bertholletiae]|uniref:SH3 domain-containing protein n=1 Tax=Aspergillus bertholletiae TaxID=1226010 RepID=A0A5N7BJF3_9EURO|nr:hypothetical protein BDV26DRAFT_288918 [Aspergillus bertholletiae]
MQPKEVSAAPEQPSDIEGPRVGYTEFADGPSGNQRYPKDIETAESKAGLYSRYQGSSWSDGTQSATPDDGLYHPGQIAGNQTPQKPATDNGLSSAQGTTGWQGAHAGRPGDGSSSTGQALPGSPGTNGWSQHSSVSQAGSAASGGQGAQASGLPAGPAGATGATAGGQGSQATTPGNGAPIAGQASVEGTWQQQVNTTLSGEQATQATSQVQLAPTPIPNANTYSNEQNTWGSGTGEQSSPDNGLYYPGGWAPELNAIPTSTSPHPTSTYPHPEGTRTPLPSPPSSSNSTSMPTTTNNPSDSTAGNIPGPAKVAVPVSVGVVAAAMVGCLLWWLYRKSQARAAKRRNQKLEEGRYTEDPGSSFVVRSVSKLCGHGMFNYVQKPTIADSPSSLSISKRSCSECSDSSEDLFEAKKVHSPGKTNHDIEKLATVANNPSPEMLAPDGRRQDETSKPSTTPNAAMYDRPRRITTPTSLPGVPEEPEDDGSGSTPPNSGVAAEKVYLIELGFSPGSAKHIELKQGQTAIILEEYNSGWALCRLPESKVEGLAPRACLSASPVKPVKPVRPAERQVSGSNHPMQQPQYNVSQFSFSSVSTGLGLDGGQTSKS